MALKAVGSSPIIHLAKNVSSVGDTFFVLKDEIGRSFILVCVILSVNLKSYYSG